MLNNDLTTINLSVAQYICTNISIQCETTLCALSDFFPYPTGAKLCHSSKCFRMFSLSSDEGHANWKLGRQSQAQTFARQDETRTELEFCRVFMEHFRTDICFRSHIKRTGRKINLLFNVRITNCQRFIGLSVLWSLRPFRFFCHTI